MTLKETTVAIWSQAEPEVTFNAVLSKDSAHARRAPYRVLPADHSVSLDVDPVAFDSVLRVHPYGLEVGNVRGEYAKHTNWSKFVSVGLFVFSGLTAFVGLEACVSGFFLSDSIVIVAAYFCLCAGMMFRRWALYQSIDDPVLFCRKSRVVYVRPYIMGGFFRFWVRGQHGSVVAYRWDDQIRARIYNYVYFRGANLASEGFELALLAIRDGTANEVERLIPLGTQANGFDVDQLALWEHIRQYMEEDGPPLQPGDKLRATDLSRVPEFPAEIIEEAGGPALGQDAIDQLVQLKRRQ